MNGLFKASKKEPVGAGVFKFSFKLGGDEDAEDNAPGKKKNKNKKKKKKPSASAGANGAEVMTENDVEEPTEVNFLKEGRSEVDGIVGLLNEVQISDELRIGEESASSQVKPLSKSQKKNLQKKNAKKVSDQQSVCSAAPSQTPISSGCSKSGSSNEVGVQKPRSDVQLKTAAKSNSSAIASVSDDEFAVPEPKAPKNKKPKAQPRAKPKAAHEPKATGLAFAHLPSPEQRGPHFISSKDPELDEATKLRFKYGMGRNLVAIGPAKVRDPNWLPPPPGLTRSTPLSGSIFGNSNISSSGSSSSAGVAKGSSPVKSTPVKAAEEVHSSPFSFSFNGL